MIDHAALAARYAPSVRKAIPAPVRWAFPEKLVVQIVLLVIRYFLLDTRATHLGIDDILGPIRAGGFYTQDIPPDVVSEWRGLGRF